MAAGRWVGRRDKDGADAAAVAAMLTVDDLVSGDDAFFVMTGITDGELLHGVRYGRDRAVTDSLVMRPRSGTIRRSAALTTWTAWRATAPWITAMRLAAAVPSRRLSATRGEKSCHHFRHPDTARASHAWRGTGTTPAGASRQTPGDWLRPRSGWPGDHSGDTWRPCCNADRSCLTHLGSVAQRHAARKRHSIQPPFPRVVASLKSS